VRILVTGHDGYVGSVLCPLLQARGHQVSGLDTNYFTECGWAPGPSVIPACSKDIRDLTVADLSGLDAIVHLAALSNDPMGDLNDAWTVEINHAASVRLARLAKDAGVSRFVYASSCSLYGAGGDDAVDERAPLRPLTPYALSKARSEEDIAPLADAAFSPVFMRSATAYGVSPRMRFDLVLNTMVVCAMTRRTIVVTNGGTHWRPLVHVEDIARAFTAALEAPRALVHAQAFNVGATDDNYRIGDIARIVAARVSCAIQQPPNQGVDNRSYRVDFTKIARTLGFRPKWHAESGIAQLQAALESQPVTFDESLGPRFMRLAQLRRLLDEGRLDDSLRWRAMVQERSSEGPSPTHRAAAA